MVLLVRQALRKTIFFLSIAVLLLMTDSCKVTYSFSGASISPDVKTVSVGFFPNRVQRGSTVNPALGQIFTEAIKDKIISQTSLQMLENGGDVEFSGEITGYQITPVAITGKQTAGLNRFTVTVHVKFSNNVDSKQDFDTSFSRYEDYPSTQDFSSVEDDLIKKIVENLTEDIFNKAFVNW